MYNDIYPSLAYRVFSEYVLKILCFLPIHPLLPSSLSPFPPPLPAPGNHRSLYCVRSFTFPGMSYSWNHTVCSFSDWFLSLRNMHLRFPHVFHDLIVHFFLSLNNIPLSGCTTVCLSIHLLRNILVTSKFWQL